MAIQSKIVTIMLVAIFGGFAVVAAQAQDYDLVILNGRVMDPETNHDDIANVGIKDSRIAVITKEMITGKETIDATGYVVAPGFIDIHAHGQNIGDYRMQAIQGVTTMLELESDVLPIAEWYANQAHKNLPIHYGAAAGWTFARIATFTGTKPSATPAYFQDAQGRTDWKMEIATPEKQAQILKLVAQGLDEGALGIGINAGYAPGSGQKEYFALAELAAKRNVATFTHVRYASDMEPRSSFEAVQELIANADIVVFDPETIRDIGTYQKPNQPAVGMQSMLVNGEFVVDGGEMVLDAAPGRPIRRTARARYKEVIKMKKPTVADYLLDHLAEEVKKNDRIKK